MKSLVRLIGLYVAMHALSKIQAMWAMRAALTGVSLGGLLIGAIGAVAYGIYEATQQSGQIAKNEENARRSRERTALDRRAAHERFITGALITASLAHQSFALPKGEDQLKLSERTAKAVENLHKTMRNMTSDSKGSSWTGK